ncbi:SDR family oxidoreductase [Chitinophaga sp. MM2321]|uniref:SDR family NAD(P)-dependent oxidoreductase n=1 Tax=Chitinophaga sp. MM2321 TaxID=3137178 RepID=UPI0032D5867F
MVVDRDNFNNKTVLVTGGSKGIGKACALRFAGAGANVIINYAGDDEKANETLRLINRKYPGKATLAKADMGNPIEIDTLWEMFNHTGNFPEVLILNAAYQQKMKFEESNWELLEKTFSVNVFGNFHLAKLFVQTCKAKNIPGKLIIHSSNQGEFVNPTGFAYSLSKAALNHMVKHIAYATSKDNIRVNGVALGWFDTEGERTFYSGENIGEHAGNTIPIGRIGNAEEAADLAFFLAGDQSSYMTGSLLRLDGGYALSPDATT